MVTEVDITAADFPGMLDFGILLLALAATTSGDHQLLLASCMIVEERIDANAEVGFDLIQAIPEILEFVFILVVAVLACSADGSPQLLERFVVLGLEIEQEGCDLVIVADLQRYHPSLRAKV